MNNTVRRLQVYVDKMKFAIQQATHPEKKAFFERELRKTSAKIVSLTK